jgi:hypothetical protein
MDLRSLFMFFLHGTSVLGKLSDAGEPNLEPIKNQATWPPALYSICYKWVYSICFVTLSGTGW